MSWKEGEKGLTKEFSFGNFLEAIDFVKKITPIAEKHNHHPDIFIHSYKKVRITLFTHDQNKITEKDYNLAKEIDSIKVPNQ